MFWVSFVRMMSPVWRLWVSEGLWDWHTYRAGDGGGSLHNFSLLQFVSPPHPLWSGQLNTWVIFYQLYANSILQTTLLLESTSIVHLLFVLLESICGGGCIFCKVWPLILHPAHKWVELSSAEVAVLVHSYHGHMMGQLRSTVTQQLEWTSLDLLN